MKYLFSIVTLSLVLFLSLSFFVNAQEAEVSDTEVVEGEEAESDAESPLSLQPVIRADDFVEINTNIIFKANHSVYNKEKPVKFIWDLGDGTIIEGEEAVHMYTTPGKYIVGLRIEQDDMKSSVDTIVFAYEDIMMMVSDVDAKQKKILTVSEEVKNEGILVNIVESFESKGTSSEVLINKLKEEIDSIEQSKLIFVWVENAFDLGLLTTFYQDIADKGIDFSDKTFVFITNEYLRNISNYSQHIFDIIEPEQIVITREDAFTPSLLSKKNPDAFIKELGNFTDYIIINEESRGYLIFNIVSGMVEFMLRNGLPGKTILLILLFPLIATIIAFCRQVLGISTFGVFTPSIITLSLFVLSLWFGLFVLVLVIFAVSIIRLILSKFRLLYIPKVAITLTGASFVVLCVMTLGTHYKVAEITTLVIFPMLIMTTVSEKFVNIQSGKGLKHALVSTLETVSVIVLSYFFVSFDFLQGMVMSYPGWIFLLVVVINILLGKYTGLRLTEYFRFREIFRHMEE